MMSSAEIASFGAHWFASNFCVRRLYTRCTLVGSCTAVVWVETTTEYGEPRRAAPGTAVLSGTGVASWAFATMACNRQAVGIRRAKVTTLLSGTLTLAGMALRYFSWPTV